MPVHKHVNTNKLVVTDEFLKTALLILYILLSASFSQHRLLILLFFYWNILNSTPVRLFVVAIGNKEQKLSVLL